MPVGSMQVRVGSEKKWKLTGAEGEHISLGNCAYRKILGLFLNSCLKISWVQDYIIQIINILDIFELKKPLERLSFGWFLYTTDPSSLTNILKSPAN